MVDLLNNLDKYFILKDNSLLLDKLNKYNDLNLSVDLGKVFLKVSYLNLERIEFSIESIENISGLVEEIKKEIVESLNKQKTLYLNSCKKVIEEWDKKPENFKRIESNHGVFAYSNPTVLTEEEYKSTPRAGCSGYYAKYNKGDLCIFWGNYSYYSKDYYIEAIDNFEKWFDNSIDVLNKIGTKDMIVGNIFKFQITIPTLGYDNFITD